MDVFLGIDPGQSGAMAILTSAGDIELKDWAGGPAMVTTLDEWQLIYGVTVAALELVGAAPGQGVVSMFNFGTNYGWWQGLLDARRIPYRLVRPQTWQVGLGIPRKKSKQDKPSLLAARRLFPTAPLALKKHHGRADALLIADWLRRIIHTTV
jgi:hypothetical protein